MKRYSRWLLLVVVAVALTFVWLLFSPRHYGVKQLAERDGTRYWELPTGSRSPILTSLAQASIIPTL